MIKFNWGPLRRDPQQIYPSRLRWVAPPPPRWIYKKHASPWTKIQSSYRIHSHQYGLSQVVINSHSTHLVSSNTSHQYASTLSEKLMFTQTLVVTKKNIPFLFQPQFLKKFLHPQHFFALFCNCNVLGLYRDCHDIASPAKVIKNTEVDFLESISPACKTLEHRFSILKTLEITKVCHSFYHD